MSASDKFQFQLFTSNDPDSQYAAVVTKDPYTFYLLKNGKGYLGNTQLFGGASGGGSAGSDLVILSSAGTYTTFQTGKIYAIVSDNIVIGSNVSASPVGIYYADTSSTLADLTYQAFSRSIAAYIASNAVIKAASITNGATYSDSEFMTAAAVSALVSSATSAAGQLSVKFFRTVELHELSQAEISNNTVEFDPINDTAGAKGLLFTADTDDTAGGETKYFINLNGYLTTYGTTNTNSITMLLTNNNFSASLNKKTGENSIIIDSNGVSLNKTTDQINDGDGTTDPETGNVNTQASADRLVTEDKLVAYITSKVLPAIDAAVDAAMANVVTYLDNNGQSSGSGDNNGTGS